MFLSRNKKINVYPCKPQFYYVKLGFKGNKIIQVCFRDVQLFTKVTHSFVRGKGLIIEDALIISFLFNSNCFLSFFLS